LDETSYVGGYNDGYAYRMTVEPRGWSNNLPKPTVKAAIDKLFDLADDMRQHGHYSCGDDLHKAVYRVKFAVEGLESAAERTLEEALTEITGVLDDIKRRENGPEGDAQFIASLRKRLPVALNRLSPRGALPALPDEYVSVQEAWEAAGGNPGIKANRTELLEALRLMDEADDEAMVMEKRLETILERFESLASRMVPPEYANGYREALAHAKHAVEDDIDRLPIPLGIYYNPEYRNFYEVIGHKGLGQEYWQKWWKRCQSFPMTAEAATKRLAEVAAKKNVSPRVFKNLYLPHPLMIDSGTFWRCDHGYTGISGDGKVEGCLNCLHALQP
jgi:hypothetical protein